MGQFCPVVSVSTVQVDSSLQGPIIFSEISKVTVRNGRKLSQQISERFEGHNLLITQTCFQLPVLDSNLKTCTGSLTKLISRLSVLYNYRGYRYIIILWIEILVTPSESFRIKNQKVMRLVALIFCFPLSHTRWFFRYVTEILDCPLTSICGFREGVIHAPTPQPALGFN